MAQPSRVEAYAHAFFQIAQAERRVESVEDDLFRFSRAFDANDELRMALRRVPLVILTGVADPRREADRCNAEAFISKPFDAQQLVDVVRRFAA